MKTYEELEEKAEEIRTNELPESNTHSMVGEHLLDVIDKMKSVDKQQKDNIDKKVDKTNLQIMSEDQYEALKQKDKEVFYYTYEEE